MGLPGKGGERGSVYRRKDSPFWWIAYCRGRKQYHESSQTTEWEGANDLLKVKEAEIVHGQTPGALLKKVTFDELAADFLTDYKINGRKSISRANLSVKLLMEFFGGFKVHAITTPLIKKYVEGRLGVGAVPASINRELSALKRMFNLGNQCTPPKVPIVPHIPMLKEHNVRTGFFEVDDYKALMAEAAEHIRPIIAFAYVTGWRKSEILSLKWNQVDLKEGTVRLNPGMSKNEEGRVVVINKDLRQVFSDLFTRRVLGCDFVFQNDGKPILNIRGAWDGACARAGLGVRIFHDLRRTAVRNMVRSGVPERVAMQVSGHKTRSVFDRYNIVSEADLRAAATSMNTYYDSITFSPRTERAGNKAKIRVLKAV